jgi:hypothetical protein
MTDKQEAVAMSEILDRPPDEPDGDDQKAKPDDEVELVTEADLSDADEQDDPDVEEEYDDA